MNTPLVDRARKLFEFLRRAQQLKTTSPKTVESYKRDGAVLWLAESPEHPAVRSAHRNATPAPDDAVLTVDRVSRVEPPTPDEELARWLSEPQDDPEQPPTLRETITVVEPAAADAEPEQDQSTPTTHELGEHPEVRQHYGDWLADWQAWAEQELWDRPVREFYGELFEAYVKASGNPEDLELVLGVGCLAWEPDRHDVVRRHLITSPVTIHLDDDTGRLSVLRVESTEPLTIELDMLEPRLITVPEHVNEIRTHAREIEAHPLDRTELGAVVRRLVHALDADGEYRDEDEASLPSRGATAAFAPAVLLRKRSQQGLVDVFATIVAQLAAADDVPDGVIPLLDPDHVPAAQPSAGEGALVSVDESPFLPMPVNDKQLQIIERVDARAQVLVQGPPGTGKTHTAAALITHLLAQGKRVLVTAHTDRALREVRDKLPEGIKPLSVGVVGTSREDMSDLKVAVQQIATAAHDHDADENADVVRNCLNTIDRLRQYRAELYHQLVAAREREVREYEHAGYRGTLAAIARGLNESADQHGWLGDFVTVGANEKAPLRTAEIIEWRDQLLDGELMADEAEARMRLLNATTLPDPATFADLVSAERGAAARGEQHEQLRSHSAFDAVFRLDERRRGELQQHLHELAEEADHLARRREQWMNDALSDVRAGRASVWQARGHKVAELVRSCEGPVAQLGSLTDVELPDGDPGRIAALAGQVRTHLGDSGRIRTAADGTPKIGAFSPKVLKDAKPMFDAVRINGLPPTTPGHLDAVLTFVEASRVLTALDRAWPENVHIPAEDTLDERLQWHRTELEQLHRIQRLADALQKMEQRLAEWGLPAPDWNDLGAVRNYAGLVDAAAAQDAWLAATEPLGRLADVVADAARWADAAPCIERLRAAVLARDQDEYATAHRRLGRLWQVRGTVKRRDELGTRLAEQAPTLARAITQNPADDHWPSRLGRFEEAWTWGAVNSWLLDQEAIDVNTLQTNVSRTEDRIREQIEIVAARRAWDHAASPERISGTARADLTQYAQLVQRGGKLTGTYANQRKAGIRKAMDRCRPSVPVWIMPIYRIADQLRIKPDMFDVVIVDEASQAGMEATFLQYLAAKIVVIGDDKQVSPAAVGVNQQELRDLAAQYLAHDRFRDSWQDPRRSLFDEAKMRYGGLLTLTEHRRCVPEIIGFSNRIAYEPDNIRLVPVRQYGADRLEPIKAVHLPNGYERGTTNKVNPVEADAIIEQIEKCITDPAYNGKTFGVISLLGPAQAKDIQTKLLNRLPREEWSIRELRCGDAADFQGSERDVMFLSMVAAPEPGKRLYPLTQDLYVQRYNVAVSRAKDQVWLFHSVDRQDLSNRDDMRFQLLDYCYGVINRGRADAADSSELVPEDQPVPPFDSLFEQRVYNRIVDRGYTVLPQHEAAGYRIDLVVLGGQARLAVECDGDRWHGPEAFERDLGRQRELERCGWRFFRIRESAFYVDPAAALRDLWDTLRDWDIHPAGAMVEPAPRDIVTASAPDPAAEIGSVSEPEWPAAEPDRHDTDAVFDRPGVEVHATVPHETSESVADAVPLVESQGTAPAAIEEKQRGSSLELYRAFSGSVIPVSEATRGHLINGIEEIVAVEGPISGERLHAVYVQASGGQRIGKNIASVLNSAVTIAVRRGVVVADNPLGQSGVKPLALRRPDQPKARPRTLGPRSLDQVPLYELAAIMAIAGTTQFAPDEDELFRATLDLLGLKRMTPNVRVRLEAGSALAASEPLR